MPRIHASLKSNKRARSEARDALTKTRLAMEQFKLARMEEDHAKKIAEDNSKRLARQLYREEQRIAEEKREAKELAEKQAQEDLHQRREEWYENWDKGIRTSSYPYK